MYQISVDRVDNYHVAPSHNHPGIHGHRRVDAVELFKSNGLPIPLGDLIYGA